MKKACIPKSTRQVRLRYTGLFFLFHVSGINELVRPRISAVYFFSAEQAFKQIEERIFFFVCVKELLL